MAEDLILPQDTSYLEGISEEEAALGRLRHEELALSRARLRVVKSSSRVAKRGQARPGEIWSDLHETTVGKCTVDGEKISWQEPVIVTPVLFQWEWLFFSEDDELRIEYRATSPSDPRVKELGDQEYRHRFLNIGLIYDNAPFVMSTSGYDNDAGKQFYRACISPKNINGKWLKPPISARIFALTTAWNSKSENPTPVFTFRGLHDAETYTQFCQLGRDLHGIKAITSAEDIDPDEDDQAAKGDETTYDTPF